MSSGSERVFEMSGKRVSVAEVLIAAPPHERELAGMFKLLAVLVRAGVPILEVLSLAAQSVRNPWLFALLAKAHADVREGKGVAVSFRSTIDELQMEQARAFDVEAILLPYIHLGDTGENSGCLDDAWLRCAMLLDQNPGARMADLLNWSDSFVHFLRLLSAFQDMGEPILRSLMILQKSAACASMRHCLANIIESIEAGSTLSEGMIKCDGYFGGAVVIALMKAGEAGGNLDAVLHRLVH